MSRLRTVRRKPLLQVLRDTRRYLEREDNDYTWSSWEDATAALTEVDQFIIALQSNTPIDTQTLRVLFAPTGPIQEVSLSSGWGNAFITLANQFDLAMALLSEDDISK